MYLLTVKSTYYSMMNTPLGQETEEIYVSKYDEDSDFIVPEKPGSIRTTQMYSRAVHEYYLNSRSLYTPIYTRNELGYSLKIDHNRWVALVDIKSPKGFCWIPEVYAPAILSGPYLTKETESQIQLPATVVIHENSDVVISKSATVSYDAKTHRVIAVFSEPLGFPVISGRKYYGTIYMITGESSPISLPEFGDNQISTKVEIDMENRNILAGNIDYKTFAGNTVVNLQIEMVAWYSDTDSQSSVICSQYVKSTVLGSTRVKYSTTPCLPPNLDLSTEPALLKVRGVMRDTEGNILCAEDWYTPSLMPITAKEVKSAQGRVMYIAFDRKLKLPLSYSVVSLARSISTGSGFLIESDIVPVSRSAAMCGFKADVYCMEQLVFSKTYPTPPALPIRTMSISTAVSGFDDTEFSLYDIHVSGVSNPQKVIVKSGMSDARVITNYQVQEGSLIIPGLTGIRRPDNGEVEVDVTVYEGWVGRSSSIKVARLPQNLDMNIIKDTGKATRINDISVSLQFPSVDIPAISKFKGKGNIPFSCGYGYITESGERVMSNSHYGTGSIDFASGTTTVKPVTTDITIPAPGSTKVFVIYTVGEVTREIEIPIEQSDDYCLYNPSELTRDLRISTENYYKANGDLLGYKITLDPDVATLPLSICSIVQGELITILESSLYPSPRSVLVPMTWKDSKWVGVIFKDAIGLQGNSSVKFSHRSFSVVTPDRIYGNSVDLSEIRFASGYLFGVI